MIKFRFENVINDGDRGLFAEEIQRIKHWVKAYAKLFELDKWTVRVRWHERDETDIKDEGDEYETTASCECDPEYKSVRLTFYLLTIDDKLDEWEEINEMVRHEFLHIPLWEMAQASDDLVNKREADVCSRINEDTTTNLAELDFWERLVPTNPKDAPWA